MENIKNKLAMAGLFLLICSIFFGVMLLIGYILNSYGIKGRGAASGHILPTIAIFHNPVVVTLIIIGFFAIFWIPYFANLKSREKISLKMKAYLAITLILIFGLMYVIPYNEPSILVPLVAKYGGISFESFSLFVIIVVGIETLYYLFIRPRRNKE